MAFGRRWLAVALLAGLPAMTACSEEVDPRLAPSPTTPAATSASPEPEPWEKKTAEGAVAFAEHWIEVFNDAQRSGDSSALRASSTSRCKSCAGIARAIDELEAEGGQIKSAGWSVMKAQAAEDDNPDQTLVALRIDRAPQVVVHSSGKSERFRGSRASFSATVVWVSGAWKMDEFEALA